MTAPARHATPISFQHVPNPRARTPEERTALMADPVFGTVFTDHMATLRWTPEQAWHDAQIRAREPFQLDPACAVLHYAQEIFEGLKAYRAPDGGITLFRPEQNAHRFQMSAERMAMPVVPTDLFLATIEALIDVDQAWVPTKADGSLYLRPFMFAAEAFLGVRPA
ncbi:MAG: branched chain amino acid aminotransferase, partial [Gammaproteobacteria bacterium]